MILFLDCLIENLLIAPLKLPDHIPKASLDPLHRSPMKPHSFRRLLLSQALKSITHHPLLRLRESLQHKVNNIPNLRRKF
jgi:hypothetical protein